MRGEKTERIREEERGEYRREGMRGEERGGTQIVQYGRESNSGAPKEGEVVQSTCRGLDSQTGRRLIQEKG